MYTTASAISHHCKFTSTVIMLMFIIWYIKHCKTTYLNYKLAVAAPKELMHFATGYVLTSIIVRLFRCESSSIANQRQYIGDEKIIYIPVTAV